ncbi:MAG: YcaO-like family protein, partial [Lachnospiraceae bacterium]|nr:YcaO-like family protein [Lachnospiraceae bacterium]
MADYSKYKERKPEETVFKIRSILHQMGLFPVISWGPDSYKGARYNRVELYPTTQGTNGKGTDELYCSASGLAEMIERLNNGILPIRDRQDDLFDEVGFHEFPDEKMMTIHEVLDNPDPLTEYILLKMGCDNYFSQYTFLKTIAAYSKTGDQLVTTPFADPANNTVVYIPLLLLFKLHGSNGMAAGNTLDEAMVQGLSEIFERAVSRKLILGEIVPPVIPDEVLKQYSFYSLIEQVRAEGQYRVTVYDCSLGRGWPVAGVLISNLETGNFGMKLGAHPSFAVACERTLTEALQGRNLEMFTSVCAMGSDEAAAHHNNYTNICRIGVGIYPASLFDRTPDWAFKPWTQWEGLDNRGFLDGMIRLLTEEGFRPLFRDVSFLGFPSCYIVVPGLSDIYPLGPIHARAMNSQVQTLSAWGHFPDLSEEEEKRLLRLILFKKNAVIESQISFFSQRPLSDNYSLDKIAAWLSVKYGKYA